MTALGRLGLDNTEYALLRAIAVFGAGTEYRKYQEGGSGFGVGSRSGFSDFKNSVHFKKLILGAYLLSMDPAECLLDPDLRH